MRGRKPIPSTLRLLQGNRSHRPLPPDEPRPPSAIPKCPAHLDKQARKEWKRAVKEFDELGVLTQLDMAVLAMYCQSYSTWAQAAAKVQEMGMVKFDTKGHPIKNPYLSIADKAEEKMMKALVEMGMTPSSRSRVKAEPKPKEESKKERFFVK